ncbi:MULTISPECIES: sporulation integral membrane protein YtvI [Paraliobacillus]|uniref:sporulation integral membrane protein YtvI n=1 Tax=Paraliobacillus TaxID=200903 RepID=UPI000DD3C929|nr:MULTISPECIES: sporulation integral membrane protein YtvI [Paraliobacillus]
MIPKHIIARIIRLFYVVLLVFLSIITFTVLIRYTYPFIIAFIIAFLLNPFITFLEQKWHLHRTFASLLTISIISTILISFVMICMLESIQALLFLAKYIPAHFQDFLHYIQRWIESTLLPIYDKLMIRYEHLQSAQQTTIVKQLQQTISEIASSGSAILENFFFTATNFIRGLPNLLSVSFFILLGTFFISKDWYKLQNWYNKIIPIKFLNKMGAVTKTFKHTLYSFFKAQLILTLISTLLIFIGLLVINIDYPFTLALLIGIVDFIPYLGTGLFFIPWIIYQFINGNFDLTIQLCAIYMIVIIQRQLMEPKLLASHIGVNPLWMLITAFASYQLFGLLGVFVAPFIVMFMQTLSKTGILLNLWCYIYEGKD